MNHNLLITCLGIHICDSYMSHCACMQIKDTWTAAKRRITTASIDHVEDEGTTGGMTDSIIETISLSCWNLRKRQEIMWRA